MDRINPPNEQAQIGEYAGKLIQQTSKVHLNLDQEFILTTEDKVLICLTQHLSRMERKKGWIAPLGIFLTILIVFQTTTFQSFFVSAETWEAIFIISGVISSGWLIYAYWQSRVSTSINEVVDHIKKTALMQEKVKAGSVQGSIKSDEVAETDLVIRMANYGAGDNLVNVTNILISKITQGKLEFFISNDNLGGDPIKGEPKKLDVEYSYGGEVQKKIVDEGNTLILP